MLEKHSGGKVSEALRMSMISSIPLSPRKNTPTTLFPAMTLPGAPLMENENCQATITTTTIPTNDTKSIESPIKASIGAIEKTQILENETNLTQPVVSESEKISANFQSRYDNNEVDQGGGDELISLIPTPPKKNSLLCCFGWCS
jgi:hypothetical protein